jgi:hypothetical protein
MKRIEIGDNLLAALIVITVAGMFAYFAHLGLMK